MEILLGKELDYSSRIKKPRGSQNVCVCVFYQDLKHFVTTRFLTLEFSRLFRLGSTFCIQNKRSTCLYTYLQINFWQTQFWPFFLIQQSFSNRKTFRIFWHKFPYVSIDGKNLFPIYGTLPYMLSQIQSLVTFMSRVYYLDVRLHQVYTETCL